MPVVLRFFTIPFILFVLVACASDSQGTSQKGQKIDAATEFVYHEFFLLDSIRVVLNYEQGVPPDQTELIIYALPNGNSIEWTLGKQLQEGDDWHFGIQHLDAQIRWLRAGTGVHFAIAYLEAPQKSWPYWKRSHPEYQSETRTLFDQIRKRSGFAQSPVVLSSHSGGGSLVNALIEACDSIPAWVERIIFIDSNYGYDPGIGLKLSAWLASEKSRRLVTFAYNDSIALYEGKPFVSATGGTWYRSKMMLKDLSSQNTFTRTETPDLVTYRSETDQILLSLKKNPDHGIYHTEQVELNGFIHAYLFGSPGESQDYHYYGARCYEKLILAETPEIIPAPEALEVN